MKNKLSFIWWNTALSPTKKSNRATDEEKNTVAGLLFVLVKMGCDFVAFGEVSSEDIAYIKQGVGHLIPEVVILDMANPAGNSRFGTLIAFRLGFIQLIHQEDITLPSGASTYRVGQYFQLRIESSYEIFDVFVSHWPSRMRPESIDTRINLANMLRFKIDDLVKREDAPNIILLGDYNDEPFDKSISNVLRASRDKDLAIKRKDSLYNPFWKHLCKISVDDGGKAAFFHGTFFYKQDISSQWRTFDQMMFSPALLTGINGWILNESKTKVLDYNLYVEIIEKKKNVFDHLPIIGVLERGNHE